MQAQEQFASSPTTATPPLRKVAWPTISTEWLNHIEYTPRRWPREVRLEGVRKQVDADIRCLRERACRRSFPDTLPVLSYYWLQTLRESRGAEHWTMLEKEIQRLLGQQGSMTPAESLALEAAAKWVRAAEPQVARKPRGAGLFVAFTSGHFAPPQFRSGAFLDTLLNRWLPAALAEKYAERTIPEDWTDSTANEEIAVCLEEILRPWASMPDVETVQGLDKLQKRQPTPAEEVLRWRRARQASLESLVTTAMPDASLADPKLREILNDVVLYLLGSLEPAPLAEPGYAWLFPAPRGANLPPDLARQVCEFGLPQGYSASTELFIPVAGPEPRWGERNQALSIQSTLLTPDGRVWEAHRLEQQAGCSPCIVYRSYGVIELFRTDEGLFLKAPIYACPDEVDPGASQEFQLYGRRWHMHRIEASGTGGFTLYKSISQNAPPSVLNPEPRRATREDSAASWLLRRAS